MTDNITLPREVVEEVLETLEASVDWCSSRVLRKRVGEAIAVLRTALAAPRPEPDDSIPLHKSDCALLIGGYQCTCEFHQRNSKTPPALAAEQPKQEPVAWMRKEWSPDCGTYFDFCAEEEMGWRDRKEWTPLYTAPPDAEALRRDAERYKWLKAKVEDYDGHACFPEVPYPAPIPDCSPFDAVDAAIDAAMEDKR